MIYTVYNPVSGEVLVGVLVKPIGEVYTTVPCTEKFVKPFFNAQTQIYYEGATPEEQAAYENTVKPNVLITDEGVFVKDIGDGEMRKNNH